MFRRVVAVALLSSLALNAGAAFAAEPPVGPLAPELLAKSSGSVEITRGGAENPMVEIARSVMWGAVAGFVVGGAIALAVKDDSGEALRWGIVAGTGVGLVAGIYFVSHRPQPESLLEIRDGKLAPGPTALGAIEPVQGGARARLIGVRF
jgi:O-antigen/teichoic acid export membrane protein